MKNKTLLFLKYFLIVFLNIIRYTLLTIIMLSFIFLGIWMVLFGGGTEIEKLLKKLIDKLTKNNDR